MPTGDELSRNTRLADLENKYLSGILQGQSRTSIYNSTVDTFLGIRKTDSLAISRIAQDKADTITAMRDLPSSQPIQESYMLPVNITEGSRYMFIVNVDIYNESGELGDVHYIPVYSDEIMNKEDILAKAEAAEGMSDISAKEVYANGVELAYING